MQTNKTVNHWGHWVDSEEPVTGVISNNSAEWLYEESYNGIDLDYEAYLEEIENDTSLSEDDKQDALDSYESIGDSTLLIGDWIRDEESGLYEPDKNGEYAAIMRESVTQIVWSKFTKRGALCSPCYPGQVDLDSDGDFLAYDLPKDIY